MSENTHRLRAIIRVCVSPSIWLLAVLSQVPVVLVYLKVFAGDDGQQSIPGIFFLAWMILILFLSGGIFNALASHRDPVGLRQMVQLAQPVFGVFLWLILRAMFLGMVVLMMLIWMTAPESGDMQASAVQEWLQTRISLMTLVMATVHLLFIYWLPLVFVRRNFMLIPTLLASVRVFMSRLPQSPFLIALLGIPALGLFAMPDNAPWVLVVIIGMSAKLFSWIAYTYCVEYVVRDKDQLPLAHAGNPQ
ncbi:MAG: hypothetical protein BMS9Abin36_0167 [Gammaproteobacteria bacterium]|nr:MAG: hypothetical protein BMS9Abin36_0167 [Gammaproteobacteria bacterium]